MSNEFDSCIICIDLSSNGRTAVFGAAYYGSNPYESAKLYLMEWLWCSGSTTTCGVVREVSSISNHPFEFNSSVYSVLVARLPWVQVGKVRFLLF